MEQYTPGQLVDMGICPTCFDKANGRSLYGDPSERMLFETEDLECFLITNPRAPGHAIITTKVHYKDTMELPDTLCREVYSLARRVMLAIKKVYDAESVYLCTMCDGPMNQFHLQMIPRYDYEHHGSRNFVKPRGTYIHDPERIDAVRGLLR